METNTNPLTSKSTVTHASEASELGSTFTEFPKPALPKSIPKRGKIPLEKGYSQVDWMRTKKEHRTMAGLKDEPLRKDISLAEVAQHKTADDAWTVLNGKVYNMTPYLPFHPGGKAQMMRGAGIDSSELFRKYHAWPSLAQANSELDLSLPAYLAPSSHLTDDKTWKAMGSLELHDMAVCERTKAHTADQPSVMLGTPLQCCCGTWI
ncbi:hypothetical protein WJX74_000119 [Apatococcus lobatus]|uniref:Cytochrome b5 heme-binding domain-containing protein n=1 Tax=Apatococcus lobatus TaxID=904363 RepID=A0AAW1QMZ0_9CHLO